MTKSQIVALRVLEFAGVESPLAPEALNEAVEDALGGLINHRTTPPALLGEGITGHWERTADNQNRTYTLAGTSDVRRRHTYLREIGHVLIAVTSYEVTGGIDVEDLCEAVAGRLAQLTTHAPVQSESTFAGVLW